MTINKCFLLIGILLSLIFFSCNKDKEEERITTLELSKESLLFLANGETKKLTITSNEVWTISEIPDWVTLDVKEGYGNREIAVTVSNNSNEEERSATLKITAKEKIKEITVKQNAKNVTLSLSTSELSFPAEPSEDGLSFDIITNDSWSISDIPVWCTLNTINGEGATTVTVVAEKNYTDSKREATIKVNAGSKTQELKISQEALDIVFWLYGSDLLGFYSEASTASVIIQSNTKWAVQPQVSWIAVDKTTGENSETLTISVTENKTKTERRGEVYISAGTKILTITVRQGGYIEVTDNTPYQINQLDNAPRIGDVLKMQQVQYVDPGQAGENVTWNFSKLTTTIDEYIVSYDNPPIADGKAYILGYTVDLDQVPINSLIRRTNHAIYTEYYFQIKDNLLHQLGHENPAVRFEYAPQMISDIYPAYYKSHYKYDYQAKGLYSGTIDLATHGYMEMEVDGYGSIILPSGKYDNALRIKHVQLIVDGYPNLVNPDDNKKIMTTYSWYVKGYRYPVLEIYQLVSTNSNDVISSLAFYYPPTEHTYLQKSSKVKATVSTNNLANTKQRRSSKKTNHLQQLLPIIEK